MLTSSSKSIDGVFMNYVQRWLAAAHSLFEAWPISSSWHMQALFAVQPQELEKYHILLLPILTLLLIRSIECKLEFFVIWAISLLPTVAMYMGLKLGFVTPVVLRSDFLHIMTGLLLMFVAYTQTYIYGHSSLKYPFELLFVYFSLLQPLSLLVPGFSRLGALMLLALFMPISFSNLLVGAFLMELPLLYASAIGDVIGMEGVDGDWLNMLFASLGFLIGWGCMSYFQWTAVGFFGCYRLILGLGLWWF